MEKPSNSSSELCCRACLATDVKLFDIHKYQLAEPFECITGIPVSVEGLPRWLCGICCCLLRKCYVFRARCHRAQSCLQAWDQHELTKDYIKSIDRLSHGLVLSLSLTPVKTIDLGRSTQSEIKHESSVKDSKNSSSFKTENEIVVTIPSKVKVELDTENIVESSTDFADSVRNDDQIVDAKTQAVKPMITTDKVQVKKLVKREKTTKMSVHKKEFREVEKTRKVRKRTVKLNKEFKEVNKVLKKNVVKQKVVQQKPEITYGCPKTDHLLKSLRNDMLIFNFAEFEKACNVDIKVLNMEQQLADWEQCNAPKKRPAAFRCEECGKGFDQQATYDNHMLQHNPSAGAHACAVCLVRFAKKAKKRQHERRHALQFACRDCAFVSRCRPQARMHFKTHSGVKFDCKHCDKSFTKRSSYLSHTRLVHAKQSVACAECGEAFVSRLGLALHQARMHRAQKAASKCTCPACGVVFDSAEALARHSLASDGDGCDPTVRPCAACGESLATDEALQRHMAERHEEQFKCSECPLSFGHALSRDVHHRRVHGGAQNVKRAAGAARGRPRVATLCETCGLQCQSSTQLATHRLSHAGLKPFACADCGLRCVNRANLRRHHAVVHLGQRPQVKCEKCGKRLGAASLGTHLRDVHGVPRKRRTRNTDADT